MSPHEYMIAEKAVMLFNQMIKHSSDSAEVVSYVGDDKEDGMKISLSITLNPLTDEDLAKMQEVVDGERPQISITMVDEEEEEKEDDWGDAK